MEKQYTQLNEQERFVIEMMLEKNNSQADISRFLGKSRSTISREIQRNTVDGKYLSSRAQNIYLLRREYPKQDRKFKKLSNEAIECIVKHLKKLSSRLPSLVTD